MSTSTPQTLLIMSAINLFWTPNSAFRCIGEKILKYLDPKSLAKCRLVSKDLKNIIDSNKFWWILQIQEMMGRQRNFLVKNLSEENNGSFNLEFGLLFPAWVDVMNYFIRKEKKIENMKRFIFFMNEYFQEAYEKEHLDSDCRWICSGIPPTPLQFTKHVEFARLLLNSPLDFNEGGDNGSGGNLFHYACRFAKMEMLKYTLMIASTKNIQLNGRDFLGRTAFHLACINGQTQVVQCLMATKLNNNNNNGEVVFNLLDIYGKSPFHYACQFGHVDIVKHLFISARNIGININAIDNMGRTGLHWACSQGRLDVVQAFIGFADFMDFDFHLREDSDTAGSELTPIQLAWQMRHDQVFKVLLEYYIGKQFGLDGEEIVAREGYTLIHLVCEFGWKECLKIFIDNLDKLQGINFATVDTQGRTPLLFAKELGNDEAVKMLENLELGQVIDNHNVCT